MKADAFLHAAERLPVTGLDDIARAGIVVIAPHPDDESLGCGGLIADACAYHRAVRLVVASDGTGSHPNSQTFPPERLRRLREQETIEAAAKLGLAAEHVTFLRLPDRFVPSAGVQAEIAAGRIAAIARECGADAMIVTWAHDPHCDHEAASAIARLARQRLSRVRLMEYLVWGWSLPPHVDVGDEPSGVRLDVSRHLDAKRAAIAAHRSQTTGLIDDDPDGFRLAPEMIARLTRSFEIYLEARG